MERLLRFAVAPWRWHACDDRFYQPSWMKPTVYVSQEQQPSEHPRPEELAVLEMPMARVNQIPSRASATPIAVTLEY